MTTKNVQTVLEIKGRGITEVRIRIGKTIDWRYVERTIREVINGG
ncbi:hypothetical protein [Vulcanisaeta sp. JCM 14467]